MPFIPDDQGSTFDGRDLDTEVLQFQQVVGRHLVRLLGPVAGQPAVIHRGGGAATAPPTFCRALQADAFGSFHHCPQLQHQRVGNQFLCGALAGNFGFQGEDSRPGKHLGKVRKIRFYNGEDDMQPFTLFMFISLALTFSLILAESHQYNYSIWADKYRQLNDFQVRILPSSKCFCKQQFVLTIHRLCWRVSVSLMNIRPFWSSNSVKVFCLS